MAKFRVLQNLNHNNVEFPVGSHIELEFDNETAKALVTAGIIIRMTESEATAENPPESKPVEKFTDPMSAGQIEQAIRKQALAGDLKARCKHCKAIREMKEPIISIGKDNLVNIVGKCSVCGSGMCKMQGHVRK